MTASEFDEHGIYRTTNGGIFWHYNPPGYGQKNAIDFFDDYRGWAVGKSIHKTINTGDSWMNI